MQLRMFILISSRVMPLVELYGGSCARINFVYTRTLESYSIMNSLFDYSQQPYIKFLLIINKAILHIYHDTINSAQIKFDKQKHLGWRQKYTTFPPTAHGVVMIIIKALAQSYLRFPRFAGHPVVGGRRT